MPAQLDNKELLNRISENSDKAAFGELFKRYHAKLVSFALCYLPSFEEAEDVVSEVFVKLLTRQEQLKDIDNFEAYIYFSVKNQSLNRVKKNKRRDWLFSPMDFDDVRTGEYLQPLNQLLHKELREEMIRLVERLPHKRGLVFKMIKDDDLKISEVAKLLNIADKTVKKHLELAVKDLRQGITDYLSSRNDSTTIIQLNRKASYMWLALFFLKQGMSEFL